MLINNMCFIELRSCEFSMTYFLLEGNFI